MTDATLSPISSDELPLSLRGPAPVAVVVGYGFWLFLLSDIIIFSALFATYAVLSKETAGGPTGPELFDKGRVFAETMCLLFSSFSSGLASLAVQRTDTTATYFWFFVTMVLGIAFLTLEGTEFAHMASEGAVPSRSAFLSAFFALVGTHGLHVLSGLLWLTLMLVQIAVFGFQPMVRRRLFCFGLFWHALDIVWIGVFTIVYLGAR
jgi:cytochrome o ubiquinol oxidase subunit 3